MFFEQESAEGHRDPGCFRRDLLVLSTELGKYTGRIVVARAMIVYTDTLYCTYHTAYLQANSTPLLKNNFSSLKYFASCHKKKTILRQRRQISTMKEMKKSFFVVP